MLRPGNDPRPWWAGVVRSRSVIGPGQDCHVSDSGLVLAFGPSVKAQKLSRTRRTDVADTNL